MNLDKDTVKRIADESGGLIEEADSNDLPLMKGQILFEDLEQLQAFATALLKEAHEGNEAVAWEYIYWDGEAYTIVFHRTQLDHTYKDVRTGDYVKGIPLYTSPPTQEVEALKALLAHAKCNTCDGSGVLQTGDDSIEPCRWCHDKDEALATIDTNELQEPNTWSE